MGIQEDANKLLDYIYKEYVDDGKSINPRTLLDKFKPEGWDGKKIDRAIKYLKSIGAIDITLMMGNDEGIQNFIMGGLTPEGIKMAEK